VSDSSQVAHVRPSNPVKRTIVSLASTFMALVLLVSFAGLTAASAATSSVPLGDAARFAVLGASTVTDAGSAQVSGDLGVSPGTAVTGATVVTNGTVHSNTQAAKDAQVSARAAFNNAAGRTPTLVVGTTNLAISGPSGSNVLAPGVYSSGSSLDLTGTLKLDGQNDPNAVFIFQAGTTLTTSSSSVVELINGAQAGNVFWQIGSSATLGTYSTFVGTIVADQSITSTTGVNTTGRLLALVAAVTLDGGSVTAAFAASATVPGAPTGVSATAGDGDAVVSWTPPLSNGGSTITSYTVTPDDGNPATTETPFTTTDGSGTSATVPGLTNGVAYTFTVVATNVAGNSSPSAASTAVTPSADVPGAPTTQDAPGTPADTTAGTPTSDTTAGTPTSDTTAGTSTELAPAVDLPTLPFEEATSETTQGAFGGFALMLLAGGLLLLMGILWWWWFILARRRRREEEEEEELAFA
jgi:hypothetical protein